MKKLLLSVLLTLGLYSSTASADVGVGIAWDYGFGVTAQFNKNLNATIGNYGAGVDYLFLQEKIPADGINLSWFLGVGAGVESLFQNDNYLAVSGRFLAGLDFDITKNFDLYLAVDPSLQFRMYDNGYTSNSNLYFGLDGVLGLRYFF